MTSCERLDIITSVSQREPEFRGETVKTFNKKGDQGQTSLRFEERASKANPRTEAYGTIDEAVSALGLARCWAAPRVQEVILSVQRELFVVGAELATPEEHYAKTVAQGLVVTPQMVDRLEALVDEFEGKIELPKGFVIPGGSQSSAALDLARTIVRRAERRVVALKEGNLVQNDEIMRYLNRLADLLFILARFEERG